MRYLTFAVLWALPVQLQAGEAVVMRFNPSPPVGAVPAAQFLLNDVGRSNHRGPDQSSAPEAVIVGSELRYDGQSAEGNASTTRSIAVARDQISAPSGDPCADRIAPAIGRPVAKSVAVRRHRYWSLVAAMECRHRLPSGLLDALVLQESRYHPAVVSPAGATGLAQLMSATARELGVADRLDPFANLDGGARYLRAMLDRFGSVPLALAAYNAGPGAVIAARGIPLNRETPEYVTRVLSFWGSMSQDPQTALRASAKLLGFAPMAD